MKVFFTLLCAGTLALSSCQKEKNFLGDETILPIPATCIPQTSNPDGHSYSGRSFVQTSYDKNNCGLIPLSTKNYWVYKDSVYMDGIYARVQFDTLRFSPYKTLPDDLIWWESNINVGMPDFLYANDSALFALEDRFLSSTGIKDATKEFSLFSGDTLLYLSNFEDMAAMGRSIKLHSPLITAAGTFTDCIYFDKNARNYRRDQIIIKPGIGVVKYISEETPMGDMSMKLQKIMTLVAYHID